ncbi:MAG: peptidylprolyl isomerase [Bacteroidales bacterium]|nr:peptidylprolyl isomerase [Bacteroidales bacterium]MBD5205901.1 peptidylprolyl isomerase [Bacteroidales bacterium]MBD5222648.1 peptidylprolyl isomerase [Bacteroidales bacterium]MBD5302041.1 peptidylprolyl isomerase [Bacteroides sp.]
MVALCALAAPIKKNVIDEVAWVVGDEPIFRSEIEEQYLQMRQENTSIDGDPYCVIPEKIAVEKLYLHQAKLDTITAPESQVAAGVEKRLDYFINNLGSREKVEEYFRKPLPQLREQMMELMRNSYIIDQVQHNLTKDVKATPKDVRKYFTSLPTDSVPYVPMQVEAQIIEINPRIPEQEIEDVKARLRDYADRVNRGESSFSTLAIMFSEDGSNMQGGELGFHGRADWVPEFSQVAFNLNDPKRVSRIVETEYGYHIIQLIEKRGEQVNVRHILLTPKVNSKDLADGVVKLDSLRKEIVAGKFSFEEAAQVISQDKNTKNNNGVMMNQRTGSKRFEMQDLPPEVARKIELMQPGDISEAFIMKDRSKNRDVISIVKLTNRVPGHKATLSEDYNLIKGMYENHLKEKIITDWVENKIKDTYTKIADGWDGCDFHYKGWNSQAH